MSGKSKIEICANSVESAAKAQEGGAYRVELCAGIPEGGTTPSFGEIRMARQLLQQTKLHVIIRPRGGDFLYTQLEQEIMLHDIKVARQLGADGVVFGCLTAEGNVDVPAMKKLMNAVGDMSVTFHRAFDMCRNPMEALEDIIELGCHRILTSGQEANAPAGAALLKELIEKADGRIIIMPGCGVKPSNLLQLAEETGATEFHFSGRSSLESDMIYRNPKVSMGGTVKIEEYQRDVTDVEIVKEAVSILAQKDEKEEALEKKNKEARAKRKKKNEFDDDDDDLD
ncbi:MAG: copper homeostasis protein CutC [Bacteroidaceae bacterium]|nr:copper homeostasis protein CutC [Bacteroidaceae bacterium]